VFTHSTSLQHNDQLHVLILLLWDSIVSVVTRLWDEWCEVPIPAGARDLFLLQNVQTSPGAYPASYLVGNGDSFLGIKWARHEVDQSPTSGDKVKNEWSYSFTPLMPSWCRQGQLFLFIPLLRVTSFNTVILFTNMCVCGFTVKVDYTGHFIMFSVNTNIYNKKTKGPNLMELFTATGKLKKFFFF